MRAVAFTPDGRSLLTAGEDGTLRLWDLRSGAQRQVVSGHAGAVAAVAMGGDGSSALSAGADGSLRLWFIDWEPEVPESGGWDDRVRPFLEVFLRRREDAQGGGGLPTWSEQDLAALLGDLARRGFGWLAPERIERELERLAGQRESRRGEEEARARSLAARRARQRRTAPLREVLDGLRRGAGLRAAAATAAAVVVLALLWSLRSPGGEVGFSRLHRDLVQATEARGMRLATGTVQAFQSRPTVGTVICGEEVFEELVALVLGAERFLPPPADPGVPAELSFYSIEGCWRGRANQLRRYTIRIDGFVSVHAPMKGGDTIGMMAMPWSTRLRGTSARVTPHADRSWRASSPAARTILRSTATRPSGSTNRR